MPDDVVNARGELTFAEQTRLLYTPQGTERLEADDCHCECHNEWFFSLCPNSCGCRATPDDDEWYDAGPGPGVLPVVDDSGWGRNR